MDIEMQRALEADGEKLRALVGEHGPIMDADLDAWIKSLMDESEAAGCFHMCPHCRRSYRKEKVLARHLRRHHGGSTTP